MFKFKYITKGLKVCLILSVITSCTVNDKEAFNIINEAKKIFLNISNDEKKNKDKKVIKKEKEVKKDPDSKKIIKEKNNSTEDENIVTLKNENKYKEEIQKSKLIERKKKLIKKEEEVKKESVFRSMNRNKSQLNIGVLLPLTGEHKEIGNLILNALELALFQTDNKNIKLLVRDTKADAKTTKEAFKELLGNNVKLFIGPLYSKSLVSIESYVDKNIKIFALTNNTNLAKKGIWTFGVDPKQQTKTIINFITSEGKKNIGVLLPDNSYGYLLYDAIEKALEKNNLTPLRVEFFKDDIESQRSAAKKISRGFAEYEEALKKAEENLKNENAEESLTEASLINESILKKPLDSIFIGASGQTLTILSSQLQYSNVDPRKVSYIGISAWEDASILQEPALKGGLFATTSEFLQDNVKKTYSIVYGSDIPKVAMVAYDILSLLNAIIQENGEIESKYLLNENGYLGLRGLFRLKFDGTVERTFQIKKIKKAKFLIHQEAPKFFEN